MVVTVVPTTTGSTQRSPRWYSHITGIKWEKSGDQVELGLSTNWKTNKNIHINPWVKLTKPVVIMAIKYQTFQEKWRQCGKEKFNDQHGWHCRHCRTGVTEVKRNKKRMISLVFKTVLYTRQRILTESWVCKLSDTPHHAWHHTKSSRVEGWVERKTKKYTISGECSKWKLMQNDTWNSSCLVLDGVCCPINPFEHMLVQRGWINHVR